MDPRAILSATFDGPRDFDVELWDGKTLARRGGPPVSGRVVLRTPETALRFVPPVDERRIAEAFVAGELDIQGDTVAVLEATARWEGPSLRGPVLPFAAWSGARAVLSPLAKARHWWGRRHSIAHDARSVRSHYELSTDFYRLFLDDRLVYSCAYFPRGDESIAEAQQAKLELACRKLNLKRGEQLLDVGCGWGALLVYAAERYGVRATGTTISRNQYFEARQRAAASRAAYNIRVVDRDYRRLPMDPMHKIVSIGMMEHVGAQHLDQYFAELRSRLQPGGLLLNHAIGETAQRQRTIPWMRRWSGGFIEREIFPDSELPPINSVVAAAERQGLEVRDVESLREHYAQTLEQWLARLERRLDAAAALVGMRKARAWRLYLAGSAVAFRLGRISVYQTLLAKRTASGRAKEVPRSRCIWYDRPSVFSQPAAAAG